MRFEIRDMRYDSDIYIIYIYRKNVYLYLGKTEQNPTPQVNSQGKPHFEWNIGLLELLHAQGEGSVRGSSWRFLGI